MEWIGTRLGFIRVRLKAGLLTLEATVLGEVGSTAFRRNLQSVEWIGSRSGFIRVRLKAGGVGDETLRLRPDVSA